MRKQKMSEWRHLCNRLQGLRHLIVQIAVLFLLLAILSFTMAGYVIESLQMLLGSERLYQTAIGEALLARVATALALAGALALPVAAWLVLHRLHIRRPGSCCLAAAILFWAGIAFAGMVLLPFTVSFLLQIGGELYALRLSLLSYIGLCLGLLAAVGFVFLLPLVLVLLHRAQLIQARSLRKARGRVILSVVVIMAVITPTQDPVTLLLAVAPVLVLYEASALMLTLAERRREHAAPCSARPPAAADRPSDGT